MQLEGMGFPLVRCQKALLATGNSDVNAAMEWLFMHMDDAGLYTFSEIKEISGANFKRSTDIDTPLSLADAGSQNSVPEPSSEVVGMLTDMGFTSAQVRKALRETVSLTLSLFCRSVVGPN